MSKTIAVKIATPTNVTFDQEAQMVILPGELGKFGVLPGHESLIASLKTGVVKITVSNRVLRYFICSGLAEVNNTKVNIVTEFAIDVSTLQSVEIVKKLGLLRKALSEETDDKKLDIIKSDIIKYEALLSCVSNS